MRGRILSLQEELQRLDRVHAARQILAKNGGAPSRKTLQEALQRSKEENYANRHPGTCTQEHGALLRTTVTVLFGQWNFCLSLLLKPDQAEDHITHLEEL